MLAIIICPSYVFAKENYQFEKHFIIVGAHYNNDDNGKYVNFSLELTNYGTFFGKDNLQVEYQKKNATGEFETYAQEKFTNSCAITEKNNGIDNEYVSAGCFLNSQVEYEHDLTHLENYRILLHVNLSDYQAEIILNGEETIKEENWQDLNPGRMLIKGAQENVSVNKELESATVKIPTLMSDNEVFSITKESGMKVTYEKVIEGLMAYAWTFDGKQIEEEKITTDYNNFSFNLKVGTSTNQEKIESLLPNKEKTLVLEFEYHGLLPKGTSVKVRVDNHYQDGDSLTLYYYNEEEKLESIAENLEVKNGIVEFNLEHCSEYVLEKQDTKITTDDKNEEEPTKTNNAQTGTLNIALYGTLSMASLIGVGTLLKKKKN